MNYVNSIQEVFLMFLLLLRHKNKILTNFFPFSLEWTSKEFLEVRGGCAEYRHFKVNLTQRLVLSISYSNIIFQSVCNLKVNHMSIAHFKPWIVLPLSVRSVNK